MGMENPMDTFAVLMPVGFKTYIRDLWFHLEFSRNMYYVCLVRQIALNDETGEISVSVLDYYFSVRHEKSVKSKKISNELYVRVLSFAIFYGQFGAP